MWKDIGTYHAVDKSSIPPDCNIIGSHVIYRRKEERTAKPRLVPCDYRDLAENDVQGDASLFNLEAMRQMLSVASEREWEVRNMDVKSAYLPARGFNRDV